MSFHLSTEELEKWDMVVVYDREDGRILHTHHVFTWSGGEHPEREVRERDATEQAVAEGRVDPARIAVLHADPAEVDLEAFLRVDPATRALVVEGTAEEPPERA